MLPYSFWNRMTLRSMIYCLSSPLGLLPLLLNSHIRQCHISHAITLLSIQVGSLTSTILVAINDYGTTFFYILMFFSCSNGGGAFFIPYFIMLVFVGMPVFFLELYLGQFTSRGAIGSFKFSPIIQGKCVW